MLMNVLNVTVFGTKIKDKRTKLMFLPRSKQHTIYFLGCKMIAFLSHQSGTSFMLFCSSFLTVAVILFDAFSDVSPTNMS